MPSWNDLLTEFTKTPDDQKNNWVNESNRAALSSVGQLRGDRHVLVYASSFLQKPQAPAENSLITHEDLNGLMSVIYGMDWSKGLTVVLHTPGGVVNAAETVVDYLRSKFDSIEVIVPAIAMSAGTMISLAADRVVMGRQSQLGPIDPQMPLGPGRSVSARAIVDQFERGKREVLADITTAHVWAPILQSMGPALLQEAQNALDYAERMVAGWLSAYMLAGDDDPVGEGQKIAKHFNDASLHLSHGRRIGRAEAASQGVVVEELESSQDLQEAVLTVYHLFTILFEHSLVTKVIASDTGQIWAKQWASPQQQQQVSQATPVPPAPPRQAPKTGPTQSKKPKRR